MQNTSQSKSKILLFCGVIFILIALILGLPAFKRILRGPPHRPPTANVENIQVWMTIPYIAKAWHIPESSLYKDLNLDPKSDSKKSLESIAKTKNISKEDLLTQVKAIVSRPPPRP